MTSLGNRSYREPTYTAGHPDASLPIPRDSCTTCVEPLHCALFYTVIPGSICGCGCPWHSHRPLPALETVQDNAVWAKGPSLSSACTQYYSLECSWSSRPDCVCGKPWQSHGRFQSTLGSTTTTTTQIQSSHGTSWPAPAGLVPPDRLSGAGPRAIVPPPTFSGFLQQHGRVNPGLTSPAGALIPTFTSMSADFIRRFRARSDYASVPPDRQRLTSRALAPKPISPSRPSQSMAALRTNVTTQGRGTRPGSRIVKRVGTTFDIAFIPFPLPPVAVSTAFDRTLRLLGPEQHHRLLERLERTGFLFPVDLALNAEGGAFVQDFNDKILAKLMEVGVSLPPKPAQEIGLDFPDSTTNTSIHFLSFRLLQVSSKKQGAKFTITAESGPYNLEFLSKAPFGPRIGNPIRPDRFLLFIAPSYGLPTFSRSIEAELRHVLRLPIVEEFAAVGPPAVHVCIGIRLLNGFMNQNPATDEAWACVPECTPMASSASVRSGNSGRLRPQTRLFIELDDSDEEEPLPPVNRPPEPTWTRSGPLGIWELNEPGRNQRGTQRHRNPPAERSSSPPLIDLTGSPTPPAQSAPFTTRTGRGRLVITEVTLDEGRKQIYQFLTNVQTSIERGRIRGIQQILPLKLTASSVEMAVNALKVFLLSDAAARFKLSSDEKSKLLSITTTASGPAITWSRQCTMKGLLDQAFGVAMRGSGSRSEGHGVRKIVLDILVEDFVSDEDGLWQQDSRGMCTLRTTETLALPTRLGTSSKVAQTSKLFQARSYAAGAAVLLLVRHAKLPSPITPIMLAIALLSAADRPKIVTPAFLRVLFAHPDDHKYVTLFKESSAATPMDVPLRSLMEAAGVNAHSELLVQPRDQDMHEWLLFRAVTSLFGVTGVANGGDDDAEISAFVAGIREHPLGSDECVGDLIPSGSNEVLSMVLALYDRKIGDPQELIDHIQWNFIERCGTPDQLRVKEAFVSFLRGTGVPPLAAFSVPLATLALAQRDPCFRARRLLAACTSSACRPFNDAGFWLTVDFELADPIREFSATTCSFRYHSCFGAVTILIHPVLNMLAETPSLFEAFAFRNLPDAEDFTGEWWSS